MLGILCFLLFLFFIMGIILCNCCNTGNNNENDINDNDNNEIIIQKDEDESNINDKRDKNNYGVIKNAMNVEKEDEKIDNYKLDLIEESTKIIDRKEKNENENENEQDNYKEDTKILIYEKEKENSKEKEIINQQRIEMQKIEEKNEYTINITPLEVESANEKNEKIKEIDDQENSEEENENENEEIKLFGLYNPRFNCYLNSSLQSFFHLKTFNSIIKKYTFNQNCKLTNEYIKLLNQIEKGKKELDPRGIKKILSEEEEKYKYENQQDANEFVTLFLNEMMKEVKGIGIDNIEKIDSPKDEMIKGVFEKFERRFFGKNQSFLTYLFYGRYKIENFCLNNHLIKVNFQKYNMIDIPSNNINSPIEDLLKKYQEKKIINSQIYCDECGLIEQYYSKTTIYHLPYYIILFLDNPIKKLDNNILEVNKFFEGEKVNNDVYELISVVGYSGNFKSGHYIAKCKVSKNKWYEFSDSYYHEINSSSIVNDRDVILFFQKKNKK
jgi:ubiquitin C-terminal hydrolase